ncbi:hypothetical protein SeLEV6574_g00469 [Synchytrium endobioticum]|nr:hypothetical protein SeLEV6574_g00469 [Synchytrium endobioticum]
MAEENDRNVLKKKVTAGSVYLHPTQDAIIVTYFIQLTVRGDDGQPQTLDKKERQKLIPITSFDTSIPSLASDILTSCKLISANKKDQLEALVRELYHRPHASGRRGTLRLNDQTSPTSATPLTSSTLQSSLQEASLDNVDSYIELLYETMQDKIHAARLILQLARNPQNLESLVSNESLVSALARVLREEARKSIDLTTNIVSIFFAISDFVNFHHLLTQHKVGDACLKIVDQEISRCVLWNEELAARRSRVSKNAKLELEQEQKKHESLIKKQDPLLFAAVHLLLNLAEDPIIESKMVRRGIIHQLTFLVDLNVSTTSTAPELPMLAINFLKKLSVYRENKDALVHSATDLVPKLEKLLTYAHQGLSNLSLQLLLNISHDVNFRRILANTNIITSLIKLSVNKYHAQSAIALMYQISIDEPARNLYAVHEVIKLTLKQLLEHRGEKIPLELAALACNMATHPSCAQVLVSDGGLRFLMKRAMKTRDSLLMKLIRNLAVCGGPHCQTVFLDFVDDLCQTLFNSSSIIPSEFFVELLGTLSALNIPSFDYAKLCETYNLLDVLMSRLQAGSRSRSSINEDEDDILLECVCLIGSMAHDDDFVAVADQRGILSVLIDLMIAKEEDDEMVLQILYALYHFLLHAGPRNTLLQKTQLVSYLIDLLYDRNPSIRKMCDVCLDVIGESGSEWSARIRRQRFRHHNSTWLRFVTESSSRFRPMTGSQSSDILNASRLVYSAGRVSSASVQQPKYQDTSLEASDDEDDYDYGRQKRAVVPSMSYFLPHLHSGWHVDQAILNEDTRVVIIRFGHDWDPTCMKMDEILYKCAEKVKNYAVIYLVDISEVPDFNKMNRK